MYASPRVPSVMGVSSATRPGRQQLEAALAVAEVVRLARDRGLGELATLKRFRVRV